MPVEAHRERNLVHIKRDEVKLAIVLCLVGGVGYYFPEARMLLNTAFVVALFGGIYVGGREIHEKNMPRTET